MPNLDSLLALIDPVNSIYETERRVDDAMNSFNASSGSISDMDSFEDLLGIFYWHVESYILDVRNMVNPNPDYTKGVARNVITNIYGNGGMKTAFEIARTGVEGGLYQILKDFAKQRAQYYNNKGIGIRVNGFLNNLSFDEQLEIVVEYKKRFGHVLPAEIMESSDAYVVTMLHNILENHPDLITRMRNLD